MEFKNLIPISFSRCSQRPGRICEADLAIGTVRVIQNLWTKDGMSQTKRKAGGKSFNYEFNLFL